MKEEEPVDGKKSEDDGIEKENLAILEKIRKNQRQDHLNVSGSSAFKFIQYHLSDPLIEIKLPLFSQTLNFLSCYVFLI